MYFLTGGSGVLGTELQKVGPEHGLSYIAPSSKECNILEPECPYELIQNHHRLRGIVHCAAYTDVPGAETPSGKRQAARVNIEGSMNISRWAKMLGLPVVYISTDYVYPGDKGSYKEHDVTRPINYYACTKLLGEAWFDSPADIIVRTSFKPNDPWPYPKAFDDLYSSADYVDIIADKISFLLSHAIPGDLTGIVNVGTERKSIYDLARRRNRGIGPMSTSAIENVKLPNDVSLDTSKYDKYYDLITGDY